VSRRGDSHCKAGRLCCRGQGSRRPAGSHLSARPGLDRARPQTFPLEPAPAQRSGGTKIVSMFLSCRPDDLSDFPGRFRGRVWDHAGAGLDQTPKPTATLSAESGLSPIHDSRLDCISLVYDTSQPYP
jgi:hypothetical protein